MLQSLPMSEINNEKLLHGKSGWKRIVGLEVTDDGYAEIFTQSEDNSGVVSNFVPARYWLLAHERLSDKFVKLDGDLHYKYGIQFDNKQEFGKWSNIWRNEDTYKIWNAEEALMAKDGYTFYRDLRIQELAVLSFDIETTGLDGYADDAKVLLISTSFRDHTGIIQNKLFSYEQYANEGDMLTAFCDYVRLKDPSVLIGHNIVTYDFVYLQARAEVNNVSLNLGRNGDPISFARNDSKFRLDGTRDLFYKKVHVYGREITDTYFLSVSFDVSKAFETYALKPLIKQLGFEKEGRQYYDAGAIRYHYKNPVEWEKIKAYAEADAEDPIKLFDMMAPTYFYSCQNIPKPFTEILLSATGSKVNSILVRAYLQDKHSLPKATEIPAGLEGGVSFGVPGIHKNAVKLDIKSCYPSQVLRFKIHDKDKDPKMYFYHMVKYFTEQRFYYKQMAKETGLQIWKDQDSVAKLFINSAYGTLSTTGLLFNSPENAALITRESRKVIDTALKWASGQGVDYWMEKYGNKEFEKEDVNE